jgi:precorrin-4/cobalt-precorrin-4 C11-methyltransferase
MTVFFIGAGPGDPDLLTLKGARLIASCPVCLYAGSLVPQAVIAGAPPGARVLDSATMTLDETHAEILAAHVRGQDVARVHSGDPSLYGAIAEQIRRLRADSIPYEIVPGVPAYRSSLPAWP